MRIIEISLGKEIKIGLPNFSNITARCDLKWEIGENERPQWDAMWDEVNRQLAIQSDGIDPSWIRTEEYKRFFKTTIKTKKAE